MKPTAKSAALCLFGAAVTFAAGTLFTSTRQTNAADAAATARRYVAAGYSVDLGLGQINSRNMRWLGLTWETVFDPCTNVAALGRVLTANYNSAKAGRDPQTALRVALSMYNTGSQTRGFQNGYVAKVTSQVF